MLKNWELGKRFTNLPIWTKQIIVLVTSELLVVGLLILSASWIIHTGLTAQIQSQAQSELQVLDVRYNIKVNQMGFGFRGQSDNTAIIEAAVRGQSNPVVRDILIKETKVRIIEYATLVGVDLRIIENAHKPRYGDVFDPNGFVSKTLKQGQQIKTTEFLPLIELAKEYPEAAEVIRKSLPVNISPDKLGALIRYTFTPVRQLGQIVGVLVSGDIINDELDVLTANVKDPGKKSAVVDLTLETLNGGFSAITLYDIPVSIALAKDKEIERNLLPDAVFNELVKENTTHVVRGTIAGKGYTFVSEPLRNNQTYSSKSLRNNQGEIIGYLIRGTPETALELLLQRSLMAEIGIGIGVLLLDVLIGIFLARQISNPIRRISTFAKEVSMGKLDSTIEQTFNNEIGDLVVAFNRMKRSIIKGVNMLQAVHYKWGLDLYEKNDLDGAIHQFSNAIAVKPDYVDAYTALARALTDKGYNAGAVEQYRMAVRLRPEDPQIHFNLGIALYNVGERELALKELNAALQIYRQQDQGAEAQNVEQFLGSINP